MLGQLIYGRGGGKRAEWGDLYGLQVLRCAADPEGWLGERRLRKAGKALYRGGALRTLVPDGFSHWDLMGACGLTPVDPGPFLRSQSVPLALEALERQGEAPDRAVVALRGLRADREMARAAAALCPRVRHLIISAPRGGQELARWLRWEFGIPILPEGGDTSDPEIPGAPPSSPSSDVCPDPLWACLAPWPRPSPATTVVCKASLSVCGVVRTPRPLPSL